MRAWLTTAGELLGVGLVACGVYIQFGLGWALGFVGLAVFGLSFWIGRDA